MLRQLCKNRKAQNTAEYALLIALVVAAVVAMQTYAQRVLQARVRDTSVYMAGETGVKNFPGTLGNAVQYEPYYQQSNYDVARDSVENKRLGQGLDAKQSASERTRDGQQKSTYEKVADGNKLTVDKQTMPGGI